jgi:hypothetical protein
MWLRLQFPSSPRGPGRSRASDAVTTTIECVYHLLTLSPLGNSARADLKSRGVRVCEADDVYALLPARVRDTYELVDHHFQRRTIIAEHV